MGVCRGPTVGSILITEGLFSCKGLASLLLNLGSSPALPRVLVGTQAPAQGLSVLAPHQLPSAPHRCH